MYDVVSLIYVMASQVILMPAVRIECLLGSADNQTTWTGSNRDQVPCTLSLSLSHNSYSFHTYDYRFTLFSRIHRFNLPMEHVSKLETKRDLFSVYFFSQYARPRTHTIWPIVRLSIFYCFHHGLQFLALLYLK